MEADAWLVHDEEGVHQRGTQAGGEVHPLDLAARERLGCTVEREIAETDGLKVAEAGGDLLAKHQGAGITLRKGHAAQEGGEAGDRRGRDLRKGHRVPRNGQPVVERLGLEAAAVAAQAWLVGAVAAEEDADVHLVCPLLHPLEKPVYAVPAVVLPEFLGCQVGTRLPLDHELPVALGKFLKGKMDIDVMHSAGTQKIPLALARLAALERFHHAAGDAQGSVRHDPVVIDADHASEAAAVGAGAQRIVEAEEAGRGGADVDVAVGAVPPGGVGEALAALRIDEGDALLPEPQGGLDRLGQATEFLTADQQAVLDDLHDGGESLQGCWFVRPVDHSVDPDSQVSLLLQECEEIPWSGRLRSGFPFFRFAAGGHGEGDQEASAGEGCEKRCGDRFGRLRGDGAVASWAGGRRGAGHQELQVVVDLGDCADRGAGGLDAIALLDGDRRGNPLDGGRLRLVHTVKELTRVGTEGLDIAALTLRVDGVEGEARLARAAGAGDDNERPCGKVEVDALEIVLRDASEAYHRKIGHQLGIGAGGGEDVRKLRGSSRCLRRSSSDPRCGGEHAGA